MHRPLEVFVVFPAMSVFWIYEKCEAHYEIAKVINSNKPDSFIHANNHISTHTVQDEQAIRHLTQKTEW